MSSTKQPQTRTTKQEQQKKLQQRRQEEMLKQEEIEDIFKIENSISYRLTPKDLKAKRKNVRVYRGYHSVVIPTEEYNSNILNANSSVE